MDTRIGRTQSMSGSRVRVAMEVIAVLLVVTLAPTARAQTTLRPSVRFDGTNDPNGASSSPSISSDGRYVAFQSAANDLVQGDSNNHVDVFVRDRQLGTTLLVSLSTAGVHGDGDSSVVAPSSISADGRFVVFSSLSDNLVAGDTNGVSDVFVRDLQNGTTERVSVDSSGLEGDDVSSAASISFDGRYVVFFSHATNLVGGDTNALPDIFLHDRQTASTERVSIGSGGVQGNGFTGAVAAISPDGRYVTFFSAASNLVPGDLNGTYDVFVRDRLNGTTDLVSVATGGTQGNDLSVAASISADGRYVSFWSLATNLVANDTNGVSDAFVRDRLNGTTERVSIRTNGVQGNSDSWSGPISPDGRYVAFPSDASNLVPSDTNSTTDVLLRDRVAGTTERVSIGFGNAQGDGASFSPSMSADLRYIAFESGSSDFVPHDVNGAGDIFVRDRTGGTNFTSVCEPGAGGVRGCPCGNPPSGAGRGCDNSSSTGGAALSASGAAFLSSDSLVFTTSGEKPTATSILLQGTTLLASGVTYGQGVRCVGGTLKRLYTKTAAGGSITVPNILALEPQVSQQSAVKGSPISAGDSRWYLVFYRDPTVLGGCPAASTFNATQTGRIDWSP